MPLTGAERARRFREKLKENPEKYQIYKDKQKEKVGKLRKKIKDLDEKSKEKQREQWRKQKRNQNERKKQATSRENVSAKPETNNKTLMKKLKNLQVNYNRAQKNQQRLNLVVDRLRKKLARTKKVVKDLESAKIKTEGEFENLQDAVKETYEECETLRDKRLIKKVSLKFAQKSGLRLPKVLGLKSNIRFFKPKPNKYRTKKVRESIEAFYLRDDVTRCAAGRKECRTKNKQRMQIRYLVDTLENTYRMYVEQGGKMSFTTFYRCKPFYVIAPTNAARDTCMCIKHSNFEHLFTALKARSIIPYKNVNEVVKASSCDVTSFDCMYGRCETCKTPSLLIDDKQSCDSIKWYQWVRIVHKYQKAGKENTTKKTIKQEQVGTVSELTSLFLEGISLFKKHFYNWKEQQKQYQNCIQNLKNNEIAILCDFSENYDCKYAQEVQSIHFGASKNSITLHTGAIIFNDKCQTFATVSDNNCHEPEAIWAHLLPIIRYAKERNPEISVIHFFSDGPTSQYRQKKNFFLLNLFTSTLKLDYSTWSFSESGHGKSVADGVGGSVKRQLDKKVSYGQDITNASDAYEVLQNAMKSVKCFYVNDSDLKNVAQLIPSNVITVPGTMKLHQVISTHAKTIQHRMLSCFCGDRAGLCDCHSPKIHKLVPNDNSSKDKTTKEVNDVSNNETLDLAIANEFDLGEIITSQAADDKEEPIIITVPSDSECELPSQSLLSDLEVDETDLTNLNFEIDQYFDEKIEVDCDPPVLVTSPRPNVKKRVRVLYPGDPPPPPKKRKISCKLCQRDLKSKIKCMVCKCDVCLKCSGTTSFDYICPPCLGDSDSS